jgi:hypothetical protein
LPLDGAQVGREKRGKWGAAGGGAGCGAEEALEVGGGPDMWGRPGSEWEREEGELGRAGFVGRKRRWAGGKERERRRWAAGFWAKREGVKGLGSFLFFLFFKPFSNSQTKL